VHQYDSWDGATLNQWDCSGQANQRWSGSFSSGVFEIHGSQAYPSKCVTVHGESLAEGAVVNQWQCGPQGNQAWLAVQLGGANCHPSYIGNCLNPTASDYDCIAGGGDGPFYTGPVTVVGADVFQLDRDKDGFGCEAGDSGGGSPGGGTSSGGCHPSYPTVCIPPPPPDLNCADVGETNFPVTGSDPHGLDGDGDGVGCET
jgi:hypothetical protein